MRLDRNVIPCDLFNGVDLLLAQFGIQPEACAGTGIAIHKADIIAREISDLFDSLGIAFCKDESLRAIGKCDHFHVAFGEEMTDKRGVVFTAFIKEVRT
jgi:hypothetical protein